ncbi:MAG: helix-turn-helix transcriptional regulator, partial [Chthoniobacterales bacterium]
QRASSGSMNPAPEAQEATGKPPNSPPEAQNFSSGASKTDPERPDCSTPSNSASGSTRETRPPTTPGVKQPTGMSPLQFVTRERITRAQQLIRETKRSLIEIGLEVGYKNPSHFAQVFRRVAGVTPTEFRSAL